MKDVYIPADISIGDRNFSFGELHTLFADTGGGAAMRENARYGVKTGFQPEGFPNNEWIDILGNDANNLEHLRLSLGMTRQFLNYCRNPRDGWSQPLSPLATFSEDEERLLQVTAVMHDWGESRSGDTPYSLKTKEKEAVEMGHLRDIFREIIGAEGNLLEPEKFIAEQVVQIDNEKDTKLGLAFNMIERMGYARTGLRAYSQMPYHEGNVRTGLESLALEVVPYHVDTLIDYATTYPPVYSFLKRGESRLSPVINDAHEKHVTPKNLAFSIDDLHDKWFSQFLPSLAA